MWLRDLVKEDLTKILLMIIERLEFLRFAWYFVNILIYGLFIKYWVIFGIINIRIDMFYRLY
jgi:hypothetical protein